MKKTVLSVISIILMLIMVFSLASCSSLPSAIKDKKIEKAESFMDINPSDENIASIINKTNASWLVALGSDDVITGYSEKDNAIYTVYYTSFSSSDMSYYGVDQSKIIPSVKGISKTITKSVDFGSYTYGVIVVNGSKSINTSNVLFVLKNNEEVANYTEWKK